MSKKSKSKDKLSSLNQRYPKWKLFTSGLLAVIVIIAVAIVLWPSNESTTAQVGDTVNVSYRGTADDGWIFDSRGMNNESAPKQLVIGSNKMPPGFEKGIIGMSVDQTRTFRVSPDEGYGPLEITEDIGNFPIDANISVGYYFSITTPEGLYMETKITAIHGSTVTLENINPLAGQYLNYEVTLVELIKAEPTATNTSG